MKYSTILLIVFAACLDLQPAFGGNNYLFTYFIYVLKLNKALL